MYNFNTFTIDFHLYTVYICIVSGRQTNPLEKTKKMKKKAQDVYLGFGNISGKIKGSLLHVDTWSIDANYYCHCSGIGRDIQEMDSYSIIPPKTLFLVETPDQDIIFWWDGKQVDWIANIFQGTQFFLSDEAPEWMKAIPFEGDASKWLERIQNRTCKK